MGGGRWEGKKRNGGVRIFDVAGADAFGLAIFRVWPGSLAVITKLSHITVAVTCTRGGGRSGLRQPSVNATPRGLCSFSTPTVSG